MQIETPDEYRHALEQLKRLGRDDPERHRLEAAVEAYAQQHEGTGARRGRPPARPGGKYPGD